MQPRHVLVCYYACGTLQVRHSEFLAEHLGEWPGPIVEEETGEVLGFHRGFWFHTVGQRKGVRCLERSLMRPLRTRQLPAPLIC